MIWIYLIKYNCLIRFSTHDFKGYICWRFAGFVLNVAGVLICRMLFDWMDCVEAVYVHGFGSQWRYCGRFRCLMFFRCLYVMFCFSIFSIYRLRCHFSKCSERIGCWDVLATIWLEIVWEVLSMPIAFWFLEKAFAMFFFS